jgi:hypothetical protein
MDIAALKKEAKSKKTAASRLEQLARNPDTSVQQAVAGNPSTPAAALEYLGGHGKFNIRKAVAKNPNTPDAVLEKLSRHKQATVREAVASREVLPESIALHFAKSDEKNLKMALFYRHHSAKVWETLATDTDEEVRESVAGEEAISDALFEQLLKDPNPNVRSALGENEKIQGRPDWLERLSKDPEPLVRKSALVYGGAKMTEHLLYDPSEVVRCEVAESEHLTNKIVQVLLKDSVEEVRMALAGNDVLFQSVPHGLAAALVTDVAKVRWALAGNQDTPLVTLEQLAADVEAHIRWQVAQNSSTPKAVLQKLSKDKDKSKFWYTDEFAEEQDPEDAEYRTTIAQEAKERLEMMEEDEA